MKIFSNFSDVTFINCTKKYLRALSLLALVSIVTGCLTNNDSVDYSGELLLLADQEGQIIQGEAEVFSGVALTIDFQAMRSEECTEIISTPQGTSIPATGSITLTDENGEVIINDAVTSTVCSDGSNAPPGVIGGSAWVTESGVIVIEYNWGSEEVLIDAGGLAEQVSSQANQTQIVLIALDGDTLLNVEGGGFVTGFFSPAEPLEPVSLNDWGTGFNVTYEYTIKESDTLNGVLSAWKLDLGYTGAATIRKGWINGYNGKVSGSSSSAGYSFTNETQRYKPELTAGDVITYSVSARGAGFEAEDFKMQFTSLDQTDDSSGDPSCQNPVAVSLPFTHGGSGSFCWEITGNIQNVNSWNGSTVSINDTDYSNQWSSNMPTKINGSYYVRFEGSSDYSHFEAR